MYLIVLIAVLGLIVSGCIPVVPPAVQNESETLLNKNPAQLVGLSRHYQTTTTSTNFYLAIGLASPGDFWSIAGAPTYNLFQGMTPGAFLFEDIQFGSSSEGQTYTVSSVSDDPDFDDFAAFLTNGTNQNIWEAWIWPMNPVNAGGMRWQINESDVFSGTDVGTDFPGWTIQSVSLTFDDIYTVHSGDFDWLTMNYTVRIYAGPPNQPPVVDSVAASPGQLWPPNGKPVSVTITVDATDPNGPEDIVRTTYSVTDEYGTYNVAETDLPEDDVISLIAERDGKDKDGRVYTIIVTVYDSSGLTDSGSVDVVVPHDQGNRL